MVRCTSAANLISSLSSPPLSSLARRGDNNRSTLNQLVKHQPFELSFATVEDNDLGLIGTLFSSVIKTIRITEAE